jgi:hypothetical protein
LNAIHGYAFTWLAVPESCVPACHSTEFRMFGCSDVRMFGCSDVRINLMKAKFVSFMTQCM